MEFLIISGLSGAGKSRVADTLEDLDYYCVDNMPVALLPRFAELCLATRGRYDRVALVVDARERLGFEELFRALHQLRALNCPYRILFVEATCPAIVRRYKETRRPHPLSGECSSLEDAVKRETELLRPVRECADFIIDTTGFRLSRLQKELCRILPGVDDPYTFGIRFTAFGFKYGIPMDADLVFDVRFLPNPFYEEALRPLDGLDERVADYVLRRAPGQELLQRLSDLIEFLLPQYAEEGKRELVVAIGCTGGRHRSVAVANALTEAALQAGHQARLICRDIDKG